MKIKLRKRRKCPACDSPDTLAAGKLNGYLMVRCNECGLLYAWEVPTDDELVKIYNDTYQSLDNYKSKIEELKKFITYSYSPQGYNRVRQLLKRIYFSRIVPKAFIPIGYDRNRVFLKPVVPKPGGKLLEIGCGSGQFMVAAKARGWEVEGIDLSSEVIEATASIHGLPVRQGSLDTLHYEKFSYRAIVAWEVLEHLVNPGQFLLQVRELLRPDGVFACSVPNHGSRVASFRDGPMGPASVPPIHLNFWDCKSFGAFAKVNGFRPLHLAPKRSLMGQVGWQRNKFRFFWNQLAALAGLREGANIFAVLVPRDKVKR
jgi:2-polyprenyl-3-methyl-5-hydroxy-6-metoxy-1,4-benzoquinol methylase